MPTADSTSNNNNMDVDTTSEIKFRNYKPRDDQLKKHMVERPAIPAISNEINEKLKLIAAQEPDLDVLNLAPKKANWDLERDISKRMEKLEEKTQRAVIQLLRNKLNNKPNNNNDDDISRKVTMQMARDVEEDDV